MCLKLKTYKYLEMNKCLRVQRQLACVSETSSEEVRPEKWHSVQCGFLAKHVLGSDVAMVCSHLPMADCGTPFIVHNHRCKGNITASKYVLQTCLQKLKQSTKALVSLKFLRF